MEGMHTGVYEVVVFVFRDGTGLRLLEFLVFDFFELDHGGFWVERVGSGVYLVLQDKGWMQKGLAS